MNFLNKFRRLHWKLTISYTLVSGSLFGGMLLLFLVALFFFIRGDTVQAFIHNVLLTNVPQQTTLFFEESSPDIEGLEQWLDSILAGNVLTVRSERGGGVSFDHTRYVAVLDDLGKLLAVEPDSAWDEVEGDTAVSTILPNAFANITEPEQLSQLNEAGDAIFLAIPVRTEQSAQLQAVVFIKTGNQSGIPGAPPTFRDITFMILSVFATAFCVAAISSYFAARGLTKRLRLLAASTELWAKGDFSVAIQDNSQDEIGQLARQLDRMAEQLQNLLTTRSDLAALEERNRLARDLHDSVKQQIFATVMQLGAAKTLIDQKPQTAKTHLVEGDALARQAQLELTGLIHELRPVNLREKGFVEAVREYVMDWSARTRIQASVQASEELFMPMVAGQELFRVLQEALSNVARHSQAETVAVSVSEGDNEFVLTIQDNGQGFDLQREYHQGVGLLSMRERIEGLNGRFHIQTQPEKGTTITATVKYND